MEIQEAHAFADRLRPNIEALSAMPDEILRQQATDALLYSSEAHEAEQAMRRQLTESLGGYILNHMYANEASQHVNMNEAATTETEEQQDKLLDAEQAKREALNAETSELIKHPHANEIVDSLVSILKMPITESKASKRRAAEQRRDRRFANAIDKHSREMINDPQLLLSVFAIGDEANKTVPLDKSQHDPHMIMTTAFTTAFTSALGKSIRQYRNELTSDGAAEYIKLIQSTKTEERQQLLSQVFHRCIVSANTQQEVIDTHAKLVEATFSLLPDYQAFKNGVRVINFLSAIIPYGTRYASEFLAANNATHARSIQEKAANMGGWLRALDALTSRGGHEAHDVDTKIRESETFRSTVARVEQEGRLSMGNDAYKQLRYDWSEAGELLRQVPDMIRRGEDPHDYLPKWFTDITIDSQYPLGREFDRLFGALGRIYYDIQEFAKSPEGYATKEFMTMPVDEDWVIDIFIPEKADAGLMLSVPLMVSHYFREHKEEILSSGKIAEFEALNYGHTPARAFFVADYPESFWDEKLRMEENADKLLRKIAAQYRKRVPFDEMITHSINELAFDGFDYKFNGSDTIDTDWLFNGHIALQESLRHASDRIVGMRGIEFPFVDEKLINQGFQKVIFKRLERDDPSRIKVQMVKNSKTIEFIFKDFKLATDEHYNAYDELSSRTAVIYCLELLEKWATAPVVETDEGTIGEGYSHPTTGGFFRYLGVMENGYKRRRTDDQWEVCVDQVSKDIDFESERRKYNDQTGKQRNSTWVRFTEDDNPNKHPVRIYLDHPNTILNTD